MALPNEDQLTTQGAKLYVVQTIPGESDGERAVKLQLEAAACEVSARGDEVAQHVLHRIQIAPPIDAPRLGFPGLTGETHTVDQCDKDQAKNGDGNQQLQESEAAAVARAERRVTHWRSVC